MSFNFEERCSDSTFIEAIWHTRSEQSGSFISSASVQSEMVVVHYNGKTSINVRGPETRPSRVDFEADVEFVGIRFKPGAFMPHLLPQNIMDRRDAILPEAGSSKSFWLNGSAWQFPDFENADTFIHRLTREGLLVYDPVVESVLEGQDTDLSLRAVQYRFLRATGVTQNTFHQIERARRAAAMLEEGCSILDTVYSAGYFDQAHLTRSLKRFMGQTPAQILRLKQPV